MHAHSLMWFPSPPPPISRPGHRVWNQGSHDAFFHGFFGLHFRYMLFLRLQRWQLSLHLSPCVHALCVFTGPAVYVLSLHERPAQDGADPCNLNPGNPQV